MMAASPKMQPGIAVIKLKLFYPDPKPETKARQRPEIDDSKFLF